MLLKSNRIYIIFSWVLFPYFKVPKDRSPKHNYNFDTLYIALASSFVTKPTCIFSCSINKFWLQLNIGRGHIWNAYKLIKYKLTKNNKIRTDLYTCPMFHVIRFPFSPIHESFLTCRHFLYLEIYYPFSNHLFRILKSFFRPGMLTIRFLVLNIHYILKL